MAVTERRKALWPEGTGRSVWPVRHGPEILFVLLVSLLWRLPSFFEPPWVNDEGTYFSVAQAMAHGYRLYRDVWENKPPGLYLLYSAVYHLVGSSLFAIRVVTSVAALGVVLVTFRLAQHYAGRRAGLTAAMLAGLLLGVPFLEGTTGNAEMFVSLLAALGVYWAIVRDQPIVAGLALVAAVLFKSVGAFDAAALGLWLLFQRRRTFWPYATTFALGVAGGLALALASGILAPMVYDAIVYATGYVGYGNGGVVSWLLLLKALGLLAATVALRRAPFPVLWLAYAVSGTLVSGRDFGHYTLQCVVPLAVTLAVLLRRRTELARRLLVALPCVFLLVATSTAVVGWALQTSGHDSMISRHLQWYTNFVRMASASESYATYRDQVDDHVARDERIARALVDLPAGRLLVWGNNPWIYVLSDRLPATPYTSALRRPEVPGETVALRRAVRTHSAAVVVVFHPAAPPLGAAAVGLARYYRPMGRIGIATIYVAVDSAGRVPLSAIATARARSGAR